MVPSHLFALVGGAGVIVAFSACGEKRMAERWYYDEAVVAEMAPECVESGHHVAVCGCALRQAGEEMQDAALELERQRRTTRWWPGRDDSVIGRAHGQCRLAAEAWGLADLPQVAKVSR